MRQIVCIGLHDSSVDLTAAQAKLPVMFLKTKKNGRWVDAASENIVLSSTSFCENEIMKYNDLILATVTPSVNE